MVRVSKGFTNGNAVLRDGGTELDIVLPIKSTYAVLPKSEMQLPQQQRQVKTILC